MPVSNRLSLQHPRPASVAQRALACLVVLFVGLQSLSVPALRTAERSHFHAPRSTAPAASKRVAQAGADGDVNPAAPSQHPWRPVAGLFRHKRDALKEHDAAHHHTQPAAHTHAWGGDDVVYVDVPRLEPASAPTPPSKRLAFDIDAISPPLIVVPAMLPSPLRDAEISLIFRSRTEPPLERPPRARA